MSVSLFRLALGLGAPIFPVIEAARKRIHSWLTALGQVPDPQLHTPKLHDAYQAELGEGYANCEKYFPSGSADDAEWHYRKAAKLAKKAARAMGPAELAWVDCKVLGGPATSLPIKVTRGLKNSGRLAYAAAENFYTAAAMWKSVGATDKAYECREHGFKWDSAGLILIRTADGVL